MLDALAQRLPAEAVLVEETPSSQPELYRRVAVRSPGGYMACGNGGLGFGVAGSIGLRMGNPSRPVVAVVGDGSSMYAIQALWSAAHYEVGVLIIVMANGRYKVMDNLARQVQAPGRLAGLRLDRHRRDRALPRLPGDQRQHPRGADRHLRRGPARIDRAARAAARRSGAELSAATRVAGGPARRQIVVLAALSAFGPLSLDMYLPGLPSLTHHLHAAASTGQLTITACMLGLGVGQLIAGPLSDARGRRGTLLTGIAAYGVASVACAAAPSIGLLVGARLVQGMAGGFGIVVARAIVRDLSGGVTAARMFALLMGITGVAPVAAPLIGGQVLLVTSWRGVFVVLAALGVPLLVATAVILPETLPAAERHTGGLRATVGTFGRLLRDRSYSPYALAFALSFAAMFAYIAGSSFVLEDIYGISPQVFSLIFAVNSGALIAMSLLSGRLVEHIGPTVLLRRGLWGTFLASVARPRRHRRPRRAGLAAGGLLRAPGGQRDRPAQRHGGRHGWLAAGAGVGLGAARTRSVRAGSARRPARRPGGQS